MGQNPGPEKGGFRLAPNFLKTPRPKGRLFWGGEYRGLAVFKGVMEWNIGRYGDQAMFVASTNPGMVWRAAGETDGNFKLKPCNFLGMESAFFGAESWGPPPRGFYLEVLGPQIFKNSYQTPTFLFLGSIWGPSFLGGCIVMAKGGLGWINKRWIVAGEKKMGGVRVEFKLKNPYNFFGGWN